MDIINELNITRLVLRQWDFVAVVVSSDVDDYHISSSVRGEVPGDGFVAIDLRRAVRGIGCLLPLEYLTTCVPIARLIYQTDARVGGDGVFYVAERVDEAPSP